MKIGAIWDAKVIHLNYVLRGKMVANDSMLSQEANATTLAFTINDSVLTSGEEDYMPKVGDVITVELNTKVIMGGVFEVGSINLKLEDAVITNIDKCNNLCVMVNLSAEQLTKHLTDHLYDTLGIKKHLSQKVDKRRRLLYNENRTEKEIQKNGKV